MFDGSRLRAPWGESGSAATRFGVHRPATSSREELEAGCTPACARAVTAQPAILGRAARQPVIARRRLRHRLSPGVRATAFCASRSPAARAASPRGAHDAGLSKRAAVRELGYEHPTARWPLPGGPKPGRGLRHRRAGRTMRSRSGTAREWRRAAVHPTRDGLDRASRLVPDGSRLASAAGEAADAVVARGRNRCTGSSRMPARSPRARLGQPGRDPRRRYQRRDGDPSIARAAATSRQCGWPASRQTVAFSPNGRVIASGMQDRFRCTSGTLSNARDLQMRGLPRQGELNSWSGTAAMKAMPRTRWFRWDFSGTGPKAPRLVQLLRPYRIASSARRPSLRSYLVSVGRTMPVVLWQPGKARQAPSTLTPPTQTPRACAGAGWLPRRRRRTCGTY